MQHSRIHHPVLGASLPLKCLHVWNYMLTASPILNLFPVMFEFYGYILDTVTYHTSDNPKLAILYPSGMIILSHHCRLTNINDVVELKNDHLRSHMQRNIDLNLFNILTKKN